ncbi:hypothetical protein AKA01nite_00330 [Alkalibacterium kapii]|uniref:Uncharacterized protein n=1 Tax=Alkalibacterium kapii TaxID=426704 RepID=A0A511ATK7_9LACT|nr:hypothetical protein AKA01nite_00330 [Alkalibacterium kapii]
MTKIIKLSVQIRIILRSKHFDRLFLNKKESHLIWNSCLGLLVLFGLITYNLLGSNTLKVDSEEVEKTIH